MPRGYLRSEIQFFLFVCFLKKISPRFMLYNPCSGKAGKLGLVNTPYFVSLKVESYRQAKRHRLDRGECCFNKRQWNEGAKATLAHVITGNKADNGEIAAQPNIQMPLSEPGFWELVPSGPCLSLVVFRARPIKQHGRC